MKLLQAKLGAVAVVAGVLAMGFAGTAGGIAEACARALLGTPADELAAIESMEPGATDDLTWVPVPGVDPAGGADTHACAGAIRPGALMTSPAGCTMSWVFTDGAGTFYQTTAGHCVGSVDRSVSVAGVGVVGVSVFVINAGPGRDIALVRINEDVESFINPTLCHWGGPAGIATPDSATVEGNDAMLHYGWGVAFQGMLTRARAGAIPASGWVADGSVRMYGITDGGDSGSPMMLSNGLAAGVHTHRIGAGQYLTQKAATRLDVWVPNIESALGIDLALVEGAPVDLTGLSIP